MFNTIQDVIAFIKESGREDLFGPRTRGSTTEVGIETLPTDRSVVEFRPAVGAVAVARYFRVEAPELGGRVGAVALRDLPEELLGKIATRYTEEHGLEMFVDVAEADAELASVAYLTLIVGPNDEGALIPWTYFPGDALGAVSKKTWNEGSPGDMAIKLHNG
jgi:hypothetical protein